VDTNSSFSPQHLRPNNPTSPSKLQPDVEEQHYDTDARYKAERIKGQIAAEVANIAEIDASVC
jgi:hypothetical protein